MERFKRFSLVASSLMLVLALVTVLGTKQVHALVASMVQVVNDAAHPVPVTGAVRNIENPSRSPFHIRCQGPMSPGVITKSCDFAVPAGKRLVIENIHGRIQMPVGQKVTVALSGYSAPGDAGPYDYVTVPVVLQGPFYGPDYYAVNQTTRMYLDHTAAIDGRVEIMRDASTDAAFIEINVSGYLVGLL